jgi:LacI family transcriptional regulator
MRRKAPRIALGVDLEWPLKHHVDMVAGIAAFARERGWNTVIAPFPERGVDGVIGRLTREMAAQARRLRLPAVNVWVNSPERNLPRVLPDAREAARMAARHLRERGFRRMALLASEGDLNTPLHRAGLEAELPVDTVLRVPENRLREPAWRRFQKTLGAWVRTWKVPVGVFASNDLLCRYLADACLREGRRIPEDAGLVGAGNNELVCQGLSPTLSSVESGYERVGYRAAELLDRLLRGAPPPREPILVPPIRLVARRSTDVFAVQDPLVADALRLIAERAGRALHVDDLVAALPSSRRSLERRFRAALGRTLHDEIVRARLELAKRRLVETELPLKAIARQCGFAGLEHLSRVFRHHEGRPPAAWRRDQRLPSSPRRR